MFKMTKKEALSEWRTVFLPAVRERFEKDGRPDYPARSEDWSYYTDALCKDGLITPTQYSSWSAPPECGK